MSSTHEETALMTRREESGELMQSGTAALAAEEIKVAMTIAQRFPRNEDECCKAILAACGRPRFADDVNYAYKIGSKKNPRTGQFEDNIISGLTISFAKEAERIWGNLQSGQRMIYNGPEEMVIEGWAWDLQTNLKHSIQAIVSKLVKRKDGWKVPDARELLLLVNLTGSKLVRNAVLAMLPSDLKEEAGEVAEATKVSEARKNPEQAINKLVTAFEGINITLTMLEEGLKCKVKDLSPEKIAELRSVYKTIKDGDSSWQEYINPTPPEPATGTINVNSVTPGAEENRGHGNDNLDKAKSTFSVEENAARKAIIENAGPPIPISLVGNACSDELYASMIDVIASAKETLSDKKIGDIIKTYTGPNRKKEDLKDDEVSALIKSLNDAVAKAQK